MNAQARELADFEREYQAFSATNAGGRELIRDIDTTSNKPPDRVLRAIGLLHRLLDDLEPDVIKRSRSAGLSWFEIGAALGRTRQALWQAYGGTDVDNPVIRIEVDESATRGTPCPYKITFQSGSESTGSIKDWAALERLLQDHGVREKTVLFHGRSLDRLHGR
jgi:hypothetical protein